MCHIFLQTLLTKIFWHRETFYNLTRNFTVQNDTEAVNCTWNLIILILNDPFSALCYGISDVCDRPILQSIHWTLVRYIGSLVRMCYMTFCWLIFSRYVWSNEMSRPESDPDILYYVCGGGILSSLPFVDRNTTPDGAISLTGLRRTIWSGGFRSAVFGAEQSHMSFGTLSQQWGKREQFEIETAEK